ncbi:MAG: nucleotide exchange factor GrpE [Magnetococcales bacterium]|nr:nucleotide exchange factor GrpE [Magnetococcales bacterium]
MDDADKQLLVERFQSYLDQLPEEESTLNDVSGQADLANVYMEMAGLRNEVAREARQVKGALDKFGELFNTVTENQSTLARQTREIHQARGEGPREAQHHLLLQMLDFRDRFAESLNTLDGYALPWRVRSFGGKAHAAWLTGLVQGQRMLLKRLDRILDAQRVQRLETLHRPFDPERMRAMGTSWDPDHPPGVVIAEERPGYLLAGQVLRLSEVTVNRQGED